MPIYWFELLLTTLNLLMHRSSLITLFFYIYGEKAFVAAGTPADIALIIPLLELAPALAMLSS